MKHISYVFVLILSCSFSVAAAPYMPYPPADMRKSEAIARMRPNALDTMSLHSYDQLSLSLDYRVGHGYDPMTGTAAITLTALTDLQTIPFNSEGIVVNAVREGSQSLSYEIHSDTLYVSRPVSAGATISLEFDVSVASQPSYNDLGYVSAGQIVWTFSEPYAARRWYPCWDQPSDKFSETTIALNMPDDWSLAANGALISTTVPEAGRKREVYHNDDPISSYLVMLCAGDFAKTIQTINGVQYRYFVWHQDSIHAAYDWERTPQMIEFFSDRFGPYPFQQYGMVEAPIGNGWTAMEHQTFTTMGLHLIDGTRYWEGVVAHELSHQWFGDDLSPVDFRNIWLNEGFATYCAALWGEHIGGEQVMQQTLRDMADGYFQEDRIRRYAAYDPPAEYMFGAVIYPKSGWVLHMLRTQLLGDSLFFQALRNYTNAYHFGTVNTEDFIAEVNATAGQDLHWFFDQWIYQAGHPVLDISVTHGQPTTQDVTVSVHQLQTNAPIFRVPILVDVTVGNQTVKSQFWFDQAVQSVTQNFPENVTEAVLDSFQPLLYEGTGASVPNEPLVPAKEFSLGQAYPNPFNGSTTIPIDLVQATDIKLDVFDILGQHVSTLASGNLNAGHYEFAFSPQASHGSGLYFVKLEADGISKTSKIVLLK